MYFTQNTKDLNFGCEKAPNVTFLFHKKCCLSCSLLDPHLYFKLSTQQLIIVYFSSSIIFVTPRGEDLYLKKNAADVTYEELVDQLENKETLEIKCTRQGSLIVKLLDN